MVFFDLKAYVSEEILNGHCLSPNADLCIHTCLLSQPTEASKSQRNISKFSSKAKTMTMPFHNLFRYSSFKTHQADL